MTTPHNILLFDIDWTLLQGTGKAFIESHRKALKEILGVTLEPGFDITPHEGKTGSQFFIDIAQERGIDPNITKENLPALSQYIVDYCKRHKRELDIKILPSVREALEGLTLHGFGLGIVTGNFADVAHLKLQLAGIDKYFDFGAYGDESETRSDLVDNAIARAGKLYNRQLDKKDVILIGDNTRDIACGLEAGVYTVGVASGPVNQNELRESGAHLVLPSMREWRSIINFSRNPESTYVSGRERKN